MSDVLPSYRLSKSKITAFEHCAKRLWLQFHRPEVARIDPGTQSLFNFGHAVGARALSSFPAGIMVDTGQDMAAALARTNELMLAKPRRPIFEATFQHEDVLVRVDILVPAGSDEWWAIEVKASTKLKAYQLADLATQMWVMHGCGIKVSRAYLRLIAQPFSWRRPNVARLRFQDADVTRPVKRLASKRDAVIEAARETARGSEVDQEMGAQCERPLTCEFRSYCRDLRDQPLLAKLRN
ncbi:hypothetical protein ASE00_11730 [Sphingomonas sp. Root710]|uniref:hypothetical protein n=1 Tax=Sphingomonas sp. Root710 TaxID=1736594 RepID=UPI0006F92785|nr:hypothetical protein [Sphingomonas sp. Root710]KRB82696.1 hypothetical protein ASE00_11730 [Sphingomonas sp. Root710]